MDNKSVNELVSWLRAKPRTMGWDAIAAYDRNKTNAVLQQDYIKRFGTANYLEPLNEKVANDTTTHMEWIYNYVFDCPRLSFVDASLLDSHAELSMQAVGGVHLTYEKPNGATQWSVTKLALADALDGPDFVQEVKLEVAKGTVDDSAGLVRLDLSAGKNPRLTFGETDYFRGLVGERIHRVLGLKPPEQKHFDLNEIVFDKDAFLVPDRFYIRTQHAAGANVRGAVNEGDGSVVLFIGMKGRENGGFPVTNQDLMHLIPEASDYSATLLLGQKFLLSTVFSKAIENLNMAEHHGFGTQLQLDGDFYKLKGLGGRGRWDVPPLRITPDRTKYTWHLLYELNVKFNEGPHNFVIRRTDGGLIVEWVGLKAQKGALTYLEHPPSGDHLFRPCVITTDWNYAWEFKYELDPTSGIVRLVLSDKNSKPIGITGDVTTATQTNEIANYLKPIIISLLEGTGEQMARTAPMINAFALNSLLFRNSVETVTLNSVHSPGDLLLLGKLGEKVTQFIIDPLEPVIGHTKPYPFKVKPASEMPGLKWAVSRIGGDDGEIGSINETTGLYTPPTAAQIKGGFTRVRVTASKGQYSSSALVHVMLRDITINPLIQICGASYGDNPNTRELSAGTLGGGALHWSLVDSGSGAQLVPSEMEKGQYTFVAGPAKPGAVFTLDEVTVKNPSGNTQSSHVLITHVIPNLIIKVDATATLAENTLQLKAYFGNGEPVDPAEDLKWKVMLGAAQVDELTGVCTVDPAGQHKFAVITAHIPPFRGRPSDDGYLILPIPLFSLPEAIRVLSPDSN